jgi:hypothetical protein
MSTTSEISNVTTAASPAPFDPEKVRRWRLILGPQVEGALPLNGDAEACGMDAALRDLYPAPDDEPTIGMDSWKKKGIGAKGGKGKGKSGPPKVATWLNQIRTFFPKDVVALLQTDAIERGGLKQLLFEPEVAETIEPSLDLAAAVLEMKDLVPEEAKERAREIVRKAVEETKKHLEDQIYQAITGALNRSHRGVFRTLANLDFQRTVRKNLKNYSPQVGTIIPDQISFHSRQRRRAEWNIVIAMDQSGSMHNSLIFGGIMGAILWSLPSVEVHVVAFNHSEVVDLTELSQDPVDLLFGVQLSGAEDYWMATKYCQRFFHTPAQTLYIIIGDLYDTSQNENRFVAKMEEVAESGVRAIVLLAISDQGQPAYNRDLAGRLNKLGVTCFGCTPNHLPPMLAAAIKGDNLEAFAQEARLAPT